MSNTISGNNPPIPLGGEPNNASGSQPKGVHPTGATVRVVQPGGVSGPKSPEGFVTSNTATVGLATRLEQAPTTPLTSMHVAPQPDPREVARAVARETLEYFREPTKAFDLYPPAVCAVKREFDVWYPMRLNRRTIAEDFFWFPEIELNESEQAGLETHVGDAIAGVAPQDVGAKAKAAAIEFLKEIAKSRVGDDRATYLCRRLASYTELEPYERGEIIREVFVKHMYRVEVDKRFFDNVEALIQDVFLSRAENHFLFNILSDFEECSTERFFPDDILLLRSSASGLNWSNPLPELLTSNATSRMRAAVKGIARITTPMTELPDRALRSAFERQLRQDAENLVATTPTLFAFRRIAARDDLTVRQKVEVAKEIDDYIKIYSNDFPRKRGRCPGYAPGRQIALSASLSAMVDTTAIRVRSRPGSG